MKEQVQIGGAGTDFVLRSPKAEMLQSFQESPPAAAAAELLFGNWTFATVSVILPVASRNHKSLPFGEATFACQRQRGGTSVATSVPHPVSEQSCWKGFAQNG